MMNANGEGEETKETTQFTDSPQFI